LAVYRPRHISTWLCALLDSKRATVEDIAKATHLTPAYIERLANNPATPIDGSTRMDLVRLIGTYHRKYPETRPLSEYEFYQRKLKLVDEAEDGERKGSLRGVEEDPRVPSGLRVFKGCDSSGAVREMRIYMASDVSRRIEQRILLGMELYLDSVEPVARIVTGEGT
jgi:hypothetical protein